MYIASNLQLNINEKNPKLGRNRQITPRPYQPDQPETTQKQT